MYKRLMAETYNVWLHSLNFTVTIKIVYPEGYLPLSLGYIKLYKIVKILNIFSEIAWANFTKIHIGSSVERILKICSKDCAPLNKMAAMSLYGKNT